MSLELTTEQWEAIRTEGDAVVRAGAGSGKTTVLAHRFLHLLRGGTCGEALGVESILAITFTERAAAEMKRKVRELVAGELAAAAGEERRRWERIRRELLSAQISTIHAFCARVLRENPIEAGLDPRVAVLEEEEARAFLEEAVEAELLARVRAGQAAARRLVGARGLGGPSGAVALVSRLLEDMAVAGVGAAALEAGLEAQEGEAAAARVELAEARERLVQAVEAWLADPAAARWAGRDALAAAWPAWRARLARLEGDTPLGEVLRLVELCRLFPGGRGRGGTGESRRAIAAELAYDQRQGLHGRLAESYSAVAGVAIARELGALAAEVAAAVAARKRARAVVAFADLVLGARRLLREHPGIRDRYATRFRAILVDELQDTDPVQADMVRCLAEGRPAPLLFVVGDEKQSIYRFRGADVTVLHGFRQTIGRELSLGTSFRSVPSILAFVNSLASVTMRPPAAPAASGAPAYWVTWGPEQRLRPHRAPGRQGTGVRLVTLQGLAGNGRWEAKEARQLEARALAGLIGRLVAEEGWRYGDVAMLFRSLGAVRIYEQALAEAEVPHHVVKGRGFFDCQEVRDLANLLAAVHDPTNAVALAGVLRSPLCGLSDDSLLALAMAGDRGSGPRLLRGFASGPGLPDPAEATALDRARTLLATLRANRHRWTIAELLEHALAVSDFEAVCLAGFQGLQKVANVRKLIEMARDLERRRTLTLGEFTAYLGRLLDGEPHEAEAQLMAEEEDVVRLMTIHQAKGLEFPVVIVPDLGWRRRGGRARLTLDPGLGLLVEPGGGPGQPRLLHPWLRRRREEERQQELAEAARLLYVACTRARDLLVLSEGRGDPAVLAGEREASPGVWCDRVWELVGFDALRGFVASGEPQRVVTFAAAGEAAAEVVIERAEHLIASALTSRAAFPGSPAPGGDGSAEADDRSAVSRVLNFAPPAAAEVVLAPTAVATFLCCPRQYFYRYLHGLAEPGGIEGPGAAARLGTLAHEVLEMIDPLGSAAELARAVEERIEAAPLAASLGARRRAALVADLVRALAALGDEVAGGLEIVGREVPFVLALRGGPPAVFLRGRIDLLGRRDGTIVVRDHKYALPAAAAADTYRTQLTVYQMAATAAWPGERVRAELVFLRGRLARVPLGPVDTAHEEERLVAGAAALVGAEARGTIGAFPRAFCEPATCRGIRCGYVRRCWAAARAGAPLRVRLGAAEAEGRLG